MATSTRTNESNGQFVAGSVTATVTVTNRTGNMDSLAGLLPGVYTNEDTDPTVANFPTLDASPFTNWYSMSVVGANFRGFQTHTTGGSAGTMCTDGAA